MNENQKVVLNYLKDSKDFPFGTIADNGWGTFFYESISPSLRPDVLPVDVDKLKCAADYVAEHRIKLIKAIIKGYKVG